MKSVTALALRRPWATLVVWGVAILVLSVVGLGVQHRLAETSIDLAGSQSGRALAMDRAAFGPNESVPVLLKGPAFQLDRQGPRLVRALRQRWSVLSPWDGGTVARRLRPRATTAVVFVDVTFRQRDGASERLRGLRSLVGAHVSAPVHAHINGATVISDAITQETLQSAATAQLIAIPILLIVLLLVFRAPLAAAVPVIVGFATVTASAGIIALLASALQLTALSVSMAAMMGLALGVDYSLLIVSRFREELHGPRELRPAHAAATAAATAGRTVVFAGAALLIAMLVAVALAPGNVLVSLTAGVAVAVLLSVLSGAAIVPALLMVIGTRIDRWRLGSPRTESALLPSLAGMATRNAVPVLVAPLVVMLTMAAPALGLRTAAPNPRVLPSGNPARRDFEQIVQLLGYGYVIPFEVVLHAHSGLITEPGRLRSLAEFQRRLGKEPLVASVIGPGALASAARPVFEIPGQLAGLRSDASRAASGIERLRDGLSQASIGAGRLRAGATQADWGVLQVQAGAHRLDSGAGLLTGALGSAQGQVADLARGAHTAAGGASRLAAGSAAASRGAAQLLTGLRRLESGVGQMQSANEQLAAALRGAVSSVPSLLGTPITATDQQVSAAYDALKHMTAGRSDPEYAAALDAVAKAKGLTGGTNPETGEHPTSSLPATVSRGAALLQLAADGATRLANGGKKLLAGTRRLRAGMQRLAAGLGELGRGQATLSSGLNAADARVATARTEFGRLVDGAGQLATGTSRLAGGLGQLSAIGQLADGNALLSRRLDEGYRDSAPLARGLRSAARVVKGLPSLHGGLATGHLLLAGADSADPVRRSEAGFVLDSRGAGQTARIFVLPRGFPITAAGGRLRDWLSQQTRIFADRHHMEGGVGALAAQLTDYQRAVSGFVPVLILCLSLLTYVFLVLVLRTLILPLVAIVLNLVIVAATFGTLTLLFQGQGPVLGGPGFIDVVTVAGIFTVLFALSIDYQVFLLTRMREGYQRSHDADGAILYGIGRTARVVTGAALIMAAVFLSFGTSTFIIPRQFGVGLTIAVLLDAIVLRLFMLPAAVHLLGGLAWWMPPHLERRLPRLNVEGTAPAYSSESA